MQVKEVMTPKVQLIDPEISLREAAKRMRASNVRLLHVSHDHRLVGTLTDQDIIVRAVAEGKDLNKSKVRETMTSNIVFCFEDDDIQWAAQLMQNQKLRRLTVVNKNQQVVGICSLGDIATDNGEATLNA